MTKFSHFSFNPHPFLKENVENVESNSQLDIELTTELTTSNGLNLELTQINKELEHTSHLNKELTQQSSANKELTQQSSANKELQINEVNKERNLTAEMKPGR